MWWTQPAGDTLGDRHPDWVLLQEEKSLLKRMWTEMGQWCGPRQATNCPTSITLKFPEDWEITVAPESTGQGTRICVPPSLLPNGFSTTAYCLVPTQPDSGQSSANNPFQRQEAGEKLGSDPGGGIIPSLASEGPYLEGGGSLLLGQEGSEKGFLQGIPWASPKEVSEKLAPADREEGR